jgi:hypothetical protein
MSKSDSLVYIFYYCNIYVLFDICLERSLFNGCRGPMIADQVRATHRHGGQADRATPTPYVRDHRAAFYALLYLQLISPFYHRRICDRTEASETLTCL